MMERSRIQIKHRICRLLTVLTPKSRAIWEHSLGIIWSKGNMKRMLTFVMLWEWVWIGSRIRILTWKPVLTIWTNFRSGRKSLINHPKYYRAGFWPVKQRNLRGSLSVASSPLLHLEHCFLILRWSLLILGLSEVSCLSSKTVEKTRKQTASWMMAGLGRMSLLVIPRGPRPNVRKPQVVMRRAICEIQKGDLGGGGCKVNLESK